ncbi:hypothetical protein [Bacillus cereus group sp. BfR-BA-01349]|uniref:hypothetical protein n=1 Tax=Bacillus cereus group sp. BfR-BA-01349 TaxID=2920312 RepID=UPI001F58D61D
MNTENKDLLEPFSWTAFAVSIAVGIIKDLAGDYIKKTFLNNDINFEGIFKQAIEEICSYIDAKIDEAFLKQYISACEHLRKQLKYYADTKDEAILMAAQIYASELVENFKSYDIKGFGGLVIACNLHLLTLKALSEIPGKEEWRVPFEDTCKDYVDILEESLSLYVESFKKAYSKTYIKIETMGNEMYVFHKGERVATCLYAFGPCIEKAKKIVEDSPNEHIPYIKCKEMIQTYREFKVPIAYQNLLFNQNVIKYLN